MNLKQLEYFVRVAELGSFSKAAHVLGVVQSALSRQVRALETDLRETLLLRNGRGVALTDAGARLFEHGTGILQLVARARDDVDTRRGELGGRLVVGLPPSLSRRLTVPLVEAFAHQLPKARLAIVEGLSTHVAEWIAAGRVDIGLLHNTEGHTGIETTPILTEVLCLVEPARDARAGAPPTRPRRRSPPESLAFDELHRFPLIVPERTHAIRRLLEVQAATRGVKLQIAWEVSSVPSIIDLVATGHGYAVLVASAIASSGRAREFRVQPLRDPEIVSTLSLAVANNKRLSPLAKHAMSLLPRLVAQVTAPA